MKFDSKSVVLNRGVNQRYVVHTPIQLDQYQIADDVWDSAVEEFNQKLNKRKRSTMKISDFKVDVLRVGRTMGTLVMWVVVKEKDMSTLDHTEFMLKGEVVFAENSDTKVDKLNIWDVFVGDVGIFLKKD